MTGPSHRDLSAAQIIASCTLPVAAALALIAFGLIEWADAEPTAFVFWQYAKLRAPSLPYLALIVFGVLHAIGSLSYRRTRLVLRIIQCLIFTLVFVIVNFFNIPVIVGQYIGFGLAATFIGIIVAVPAAILTAGSIYGLLLYLTVFAASGSINENEESSTVVWRNGYIARGAVAGWIFCSVFSWTGSISNQDVGFANGNAQGFVIQSEWLRIATATSACCVAICLPLCRSWRDAPALWRFAVWFLAPVALFVVLVAQTIKPISANLAYRTFAAAWPQSQLSSLLREGVPRKSEAVLFKQGIWTMPRDRLMRVTFHNGVGVARRLSVLPTPALANLGVVGEMVVSEHRYNIAAQHRMTPDSLKCALDEASGIEFCHAPGSRTRIPGTNAYFPQTSQMLEIDIDSQSRTMRYDAFWPQQCIIRSNVANYAFSAEYQIRCSERQSWREIAIAVETDLASAYQPFGSP